MSVKSTGVKEITRPNLETKELSIRALRSTVSSCLQWCQRTSPGQSRPSNRDVFRTEALKKAALAVFPFSCHTMFTGSMVAAFQDFDALRNRLVRQAPRRAQRNPDTVKREMQRPRSLLVTDWSASLFDGALEPETQGFIDHDGMPPWDTWLDLIQVESAFGPCCLLSWVPEWFSKKVDFAIEADAAGSLSWLMVDGDQRLHLIGWGTAWKTRND